MKKLKIDPAWKGVALILVVMAYAMTLIGATCCCVSCNAVVIGIATLVTCGLALPTLIKVWKYLLNNTPEDEGSN